jgi:hypothetical protein
MDHWGGALESVFDRCLRLEGRALIHHQAVICCVAFGRFSLRRIVYTPQSALLDALHLTPCWCPGLPKSLSIIAHQQI